MNMKTFRMIGMALVAILMCVNVASCSSDDDEKEPDAFSLVGTWVMEEGDMDGWTVVFRADGTGKESWVDDGHDDANELTYRLDLENRKLYMQVVGGESSVWDIVSYSAKECTLKYGGETFVFKKIA